MYMFENQITHESIELFKDYLNSFEYKTSDFSFTSLYMWRNINQFSWQVFGDYLCIAGISHLELDKEEVFLFPPLTKTGRYDALKLRESIGEARRAFENAGRKFSIRLIPKHMVEIIESALPGELIYSRDRPNFDYLYYKKDLASLSGRKYNAKRNHLNHFKRQNKYDYVTLTSDMAVEAMDFIRGFNQFKDISEYEMSLLKMEEEAMADVLNNLERVGYISGAIIIDGNIQALSIGGALGKKTVVVHVEKANTQYRGSYQAINNEFCKHLPSHIRYVNREEDMDIPGLREAKLSYRPLKLVEKHIGILR